MDGWVGICDREVRATIREAGKKEQPWSKEGREQAGKEEHKRKKKNRAANI